MPTTAVRTGTELFYEVTGDGPPLLLVMGTSGALGLWGALVPLLARTHRVIAYDNRGLGGSERGTGEISVASLAEDAAALLDALDVPAAHVVGWSLGSAIAQELALAHPDKVLSTVMYATWAQADGFQRAVLSALRLPYVHRDMESALGIAGLAFSPQALDDPDLGDKLAALLPAFPQDEAQMQVTVEQWDADLVHDTLDRLAKIEAPTLVLVGEQDLLTPPWQAKKVADGIPGARFELVTGPGSSHCLHLERPDDVAAAITGFLAGVS